jgi:signal peptidase II
MSGALHRYLSETMPWVAREASVDGRRIRSAHMLTRKAKAFWPLLFLLVFADCTTKRLAEEHLVPEHMPHPVVGDVVRLTLAYNPDAAFSFSLGQHSRVGFTVLALGVLVALGSVYRSTPAQDRLQAAALALVAGGAIGNVMDRFRTPGGTYRGVVDFIDIGVGGWRFWTFNLADVGVTCGAILLALLLLRRGDRSPVQA